MLEVIYEMRHGFVYVGIPRHEACTATKSFRYGVLHKALRLTVNEIGIGVAFCQLKLAARNPRFREQPCIPGTANLTLAHFINSSGCETP